MKFSRAWCAFYGTTALGVIGATTLSWWAGDKAETDVKNSLDTLIKSNMTIPSMTGDVDISSNAALFHPDTKVPLTITDIVFAVAPMMTEQMSEIVDALPLWAKAITSAAIAEQSFLLLVAFCSIASAIYFYQKIQGLEATVKEQGNLISGMQEKKGDYSGKLFAKPGIGIGSIVVESTISKKFNEEKHNDSDYHTLVDIESGRKNRM